MAEPAVPATRFEGNTAPRLRTRLWATIGVMSPAGRRFVSVHVPLADLRCAITPNRRLVRPTWPDPQTGTDFIQRMGVVTARRLGGSPVWLGESAYCNFGRVARLRADPGTRTIYQRCYGSAWGYRVEFGQVIEADPTAPSMSLDTFGAAVLKQPLLFHDKKEQPLRQAGPAIALAIESRTQRESDRVTGYVLPGTPVVLIEEAVHSADDLTVTLSSTMVTNQRIDVLHLARPQWTADADQLRHTARQYRVAWLRAHDELEVLRLFHRSWQTGRLTPSQEFRDLLDELGGGLNRWRRTGVDQSQLIAWRAIQHPGELDDLQALADLLIDQSKGIARKIGLIVERANTARAADALLAGLQGQHTVQLFPTTVTIAGGTGIAVGAGATVITHDTPSDQTEQKRSTTMDPISLIIAALIAGATTGASAVASDTLKDAYAGLKGMLKKIFRNKGDQQAEKAVDGAGTASTAEQLALKDKLAAQGVGQVNEVIEAARKVLASHDPEGFAQGKYNVVVTGGTGVQVGDHNTINFGTTPPST